MKHQIQLGDFIEIAMAQENERPVASFTMKRIYPILTSLKEGDTIEVTPELPEKEHYHEAD